MELQVFNSTEFGSLRTATVNGEVMFVGKDVADILGYQNGSRDINRHVDEEDKHKVMLFDGNQDKGTIIINESGLYSLILSSKMPNAKKFKHWVTAEVLPAIRKHGMYAIDEILENPDLAIAALTQLKEERERRKQLECQTLIQRQQIAEMQPKASYYDLILQNKNTVPITQIAKNYGMSGRKFNALLHDLEFSTSSERPGFYISSMQNADTHNHVPMQLMRAEVLCIPIGHRRADFSFMTF